MPFEEVLRGELLWARQEMDQRALATVDRARRTVIRLKQRYVKQKKEE